ncbi:MAG: hypothetical protein JJ953_06330 [Gracilimonas sp.]|uniref:DUF6992 family protein n=1 Tax=Gracilimonas sp. TaxID=1974203 RepID=UPI001B2D4EAF|nr:hypothetical protein [Gracilimonas sp.]MBO6585703.1 hypothetical protein [Gracilimonas sp.]MBO6616700.1 hypothetical protein [Gracilimonas sp.]
MLHAQNSTFDAQFHAQKSYDLQKKGMIFLGSWATLNILSGSTGYFLSEKSTKYFHQMNAGWNLVNAGIAGFALYSISQIDVASLSYTQSLNELQRLDKFLLLNTGLDVGYMSTGAWLWERGIRKKSSRLEGYGKSLIVQGGFLLVFDLVLYFLHSPITSDLIQLTESINVTASGFRINF